MTASDDVNTSLGCTQGSRLFLSINPPSLYMLLHRGSCFAFRYYGVTLEVMHRSETEVWLCHLQQQTEPKLLIQAPCKYTVWRHMRIFAFVNVRWRQTVREGERRQEKSLCKQTDGWPGRRKWEIRAPPGTVSASVPLIKAALSDRKLARGCGRPLPPPRPTRQHGGRSGTTHTCMFAFKSVSQSKSFF